MTPVAQSESVEQALLQFYCVEFEFQDFCTIFYIFTSPTNIYFRACLERVEEHGILLPDAKSTTQVASCMVR